MPFKTLYLNFTRYQFAILILAALLQRSPAIRLLASLERALVQPASQIIKTTTWVATSLGLFHATAGATTFSTAPGNSPYSVEVGESFSMSFTVTGAPVSPSRWEIAGAVPPGLTMMNTSNEVLSNGQINGDVITVSGEPTTGGIYVFSAQAFNAAGDTDNNKYEVQINVAATVPEIIRDPVSTKVATGARAQFFFEATEGVETVQWKKDGAAIPGATASTLAVNDAGPGDEGSYTVEATNSAGSVESAAATLTIDDASSAELFNLATRGFVGTGGDILIPGLTVLGGTSKTVIVRGLGPALESFGVSGFLADPELKVFQTIFNESGVSVGSQLLVTNDDWDDGAGVAELSAALDEANIFPALQAGSKDAALLLTLNQGVYTFHLSGVGGSTGVGLVELFLFE